MAKTLLFDITSRCNLRCMHCYNSNYFDSDKDISVDSVIEFIETNGIEHVHLLGGEPLLSKEIWKLIDACPDITFSINTNGTLLNKDNIRRILERSSIDQITISLDGHNETTNAKIRGKGVFDTVIKNGSNLSDQINKSGLSTKLNVAFVITPDNYGGIPQLYDVAHTIGANRLMLSFLYYEGMAKKNFTYHYDFDEITNQILEMLQHSNFGNIEVLIDARPIYFKLLKIKSLVQIATDTLQQSACYANNGFCYISANHDLFPCGPSSKFGQKYLIGNIDENPRLFMTDKSRFDGASLCRGCQYTIQCETCPLGIECVSMDLCTYSQNVIGEIFEETKGKHILRSADYGFIFQPKGDDYRLLFINYSKNYFESLFLSKDAYKEHLLYDMAIGDFLTLVHAYDVRDAICKFASLENKDLLCFI